MDLHLREKAVLITGGSKGIGLQTALTLAREGADVAICARGEEALEMAAERVRKEAAGRVLSICADVSVQADCERAVEEAAAAFGRLDLLVNNAGTSAAQPFESVDAALWQRDFDLKVFGAIHCVRAALPHLKKSDAPSIVNLTAVKAKTPEAGSLPTTVSRAAGLALTKAMSKDFGRYGIRVNTVCIGIIRSDQIEKRWKASASDLTWEQFSAQLGKDMPLGRVGDAEEAARVIAFLLSPAASYVTGTSVNVDGGMSGVL